MTRLPTLLTALALGAATSLLPTARALAAQSLDVQGTWVGVVNLPGNAANPAGQKLPFIAHLTQKDDLVTGLLDGIRGTPDVTISNARINGSTLTFNGIRKIAGQDVTFTYTVTPTDNGGLRFAINAEGQPPLESNTTRLTNVP
jgi:hypothetical protein